MRHFWGVGYSTESSREQTVLLVKLEDHRLSTALIFSPQFEYSWAGLFCCPGATTRLFHTVSYATFIFLFPPPSAVPFL